MWVRVLGSAAGGGSPQWNCGCPVCHRVRRGSGTPRSQSSIVVSPDRDRWFLVNASPDVRHQIEAFPGLHPRGSRDSPLRACLLTDAEIDHTLGLLLLREASGVRLFATPAVHKTLTDGSGLLPLLERFCPVEWTPVEPGAGFRLADGLWCEAFDVPTTKADRFGTGTIPGRVVGYRFTDENDGATVVYLPGAQRLGPAVRSEISGSDLLLLDGTCWHDDELIDLGLAGKTSREMGHLPVLESLAALDGLGVRRTVFVHMNNTNPILLDDSPEWLIVEENGMEVAMDGLEIQVVEQ
ncbi:pyrroloquinoline quinone biosynthesis protein PqqB [Kineosporia succinea]|uniref:Coenzyme PQQ synthesis protein B n=1 Tax=Kineosporia succinea TaxID=84632 RepID=A0ABT9P8E4_9ACTN|nr:pyrroloquinoline quinone biosynthesis protein PqqB [Kineosporia succinea]MDP9828971.1 pyrroloquinoline quinone biosynthesis protein B [Kineosporia succinea]